MTEATSPLDRYIPQPDVRERFETTIHAPADVVMEVGQLDRESRRSRERLRGGAHDRAGALYRRDEYVDPDVARLREAQVARPHEDVDRAARMIEVVREIAICF